MLYGKEGYTTSIFINLLFKEINFSLRLSLISLFRADLAYGINF